MGLISGKIAIVTGGAQGIGEAISLTLAREGASVAVIDVNLEKAAETAANIRKLGVESEAYKADVSKPAEVDEVTDKIIDKFKRIDILVNNAGITRDNLLIRMTEQEWDLVIAINLKGTFNFTKSVGKIMMKQRAGSIINISSVIGLMGNAGQTNYAATKAGVIGITKSVAKELGARNVRVNAICPGYIKTAMTDKLSEEIRNKMIEFIPAKAMGTPQDVANAALFLASDLSSYITGETIRVDGGMAM
ncbi:MAG TPA: 3-oxoacyl-[acyl-carrier-protein] reductase [Candidatus Goldiibacteriota bacterium]|nr:3-oxoacyl-[acyl-carrier-protein] reductase [Candidatus Goldiibacteriota bacterium]